MSTERGQMLAAELGIKFFETSAKSGLNVEEAFLTLTRDILYKMEVKNGKGRGRKGEGSVLVRSGDVERDTFINH